MSWNAVRRVAVGLLFAAWVNTSAAGQIHVERFKLLPAMVLDPICKVPNFWTPWVPRPGDLQPMDSNPLKGTEYKISGLNSRLPNPGEPRVVKFDGVPEAVGGYLVNESWHRIVNDKGEKESWIDFEFTPNPLYCPWYGPHASALAEDMQRAWRISLSDLELPGNTDFPENYMYFTNNGTPAPFRRWGGGGVASPIGAHPFLPDVSVWNSEPRPVAPIQLPPGAKNGLVTEFRHYFSAVHDLGRGMGVPMGVNGFHVGYRVVPEPATSAVGMLAAIGSLLMLQRRRPREISPVVT